MVCDESGSSDRNTGWSCPVESPRSGDRLSLAHGDGGRLTRHFIRERVLSRIRSPFLMPLEDAAHLPRPDGPIAISTDSFVVTPVFFPGGDIGSLAVFGTVNDLLVAGARPIWLTVSLILEEGLPWEDLDRIIESLARAAERCGVHVVAGDTKVVPRGSADRIFINTTGVGVLRPPAPPGAASLQCGDELLVSGPIGQHGLAILAARENLQFEPAPASDSQPLHEPIFALLDELGSHVRAMRDATRGGVAAVLHEWAEASHRTLAVEQAGFPMSDALRGACELLGIDPLFFAGEGVFLLAVAEGFADAALAILRAHPQTRLARRVGRVEAQQSFRVTIRRGRGAAQPLEEPVAALLPRIC
jgi:hydrogenase expression/formation protein HypE